jgi:hypothetical protein
MVLITPRMQSFADTKLAENSIQDVICSDVADNFPQGVKGDA